MFVGDDQLLEASRYKCLMNKGKDIFMTEKMFWNKKK